MEEPSFSLAVDDFGVVGLFMEEEVEEGLEADAVFSLCFPELLAVAGLERAWKSWYGEH